MQITPQQFRELFEHAVPEGNVELLLGPLGGAPSGEIPPSWIEALTSAEPHAAIGKLWLPLAERLPVVTRALWERLHGVALLRTDEVEASLLYLFTAGEDLVAYRGRLPAAERCFRRVNLPADFLDFYRIHESWSLHFTEDGGPAPSRYLLTPGDVWPEVTWRLPPGELDLDAAHVVYRDGDELTLAYQTTTSPPLPLACYNDGALHELLDMWVEIDREIGLFLDEFDRHPESPGPKPAALKLAERAWVDRAERLVNQADARASGSVLDSTAIHWQAFHLLLRLADDDRLQGRTSDVTRQRYVQALRHWCASAETARVVDADHLLDVFGLAHALGDAASAQFVASIPTTLWLDDSLEAAQASLLIDLQLGAWDRAEVGLEQVRGLTFDGDEPPDRDAEITTCLLENLFRRDRSGFAKWRRAALEPSAAAHEPFEEHLPWDVRIAGFDAVAAEVGL
jgi:hypothetical protein